MSERLALDFENALDAWCKADAECSRLYLLWSEACQHRVMMAVKKNNAWDKLNAANTEPVVN